MFISDISREDCLVALNAATFGRLSCAHENQPYTVPVHFAADGVCIYLVSLPGQKIEWMRANPRVCLEIDDVSAQDHWTSIVVVGRYEELPNSPEHQDARRRALELLEKRATWWEPVSVVPPSHVFRGGSTPVAYRINVETVTGRRAGR